MSASHTSRIVGFDHAETCTMMALSPPKHAIQTEPCLPIVVLVPAPQSRLQTRLQTHTHTLYYNSTHHPPLSSFRAEVRLCDFCLVGNFDRRRPVTRAEPRAQRASHADWRMGDHRRRKDGDAWRGRHSHWRPRRRLYAQVVTCCERRARSERQQRGFIVRHGERVVS